MATTPGVYVSTAVRSGPTTATAPIGAALFVVGEATYGPIDKATTVTSMNNFNESYGDRYGDGYLYDTVRTFFEEGGQKAHILRLWSGADNTAADNELATSDSDTSLYLDAKNPGAWGSSLTSAFSTTDNRLTIGGTPDSVDETFYVTSTNTLAEIRDILNNTETGSKWVTARIAVASGASGTPTADTSATLTAVTADTFDAGTVAGTLASSAVQNAWGVDDTDTDHKQYFDETFGTGMVASPGWGPTTSDTTDDGYDVWLEMIRHCVKFNRIAALTYADEDMAVSTAITGRKNFATFMGTQTGLPDETDGLEYAALYHPWVKIPNGTGLTRTVSPEGFVGAARARAHLKQGAWRAGAGALSASRFVLEPAISFTRSEIEDLSFNQVNPIRSIASTVRVYGADSLCSDRTNWAFITYRDVLNGISVEAEAALEQYVFSVIDSKGALLARVEGTLVGLLETARQGGGLYERKDANGRLVDRGYSVNAGSGLNSAATLATGLVKAEIGVRVAPVGERVQIVVTKSALTSGL